MLCPACQYHDAQLDPYYGYLPCSNCQNRQANLNRPRQQSEFTSEAIKEQRKAFKNDIEQPHRKGILNKRWVELYGKEAAKKRGFSEDEINHATYVYSGDDTYYNDNN